MRIKNPIVEGWYADPEARKYGDKYYIFVTKSIDFDEQKNIDVFSSYDLVNWEKHENIIRMEDFTHVQRCVWAPTVVEKDGKYYLVFASNDIRNDEQPGGLEIAVAEKPEGPYRAYIEGSLIGKFHNGAQPIDAHLFQDDDGTVWLYYGGWKHCNVCRMKNDMTGIDTLEDGSNEIIREITPKDYVEAPCMLKHNGKYYFMWSSGDWMGADYRVNYAVVSSPITKPKYAQKILSAQLPIAEGPGHHGYLYIEEKNEYLIVYHRRTPGQGIHNRILCMDKMRIHDGVIDPVIMTTEFENPNDQL